MAKALREEVWYSKGTTVYYIEDRVRRLRTKAERERAAQEGSAWSLLGFAWRRVCFSGKGKGRAVAGTVVEVAGKAFILSRVYGPVRSVMSAGKRGVRPACIRRPTAKGPSEVNRRGGPAVFVGRRLAALRHERRWISESIPGVQRQ